MARVSETNQPDRRLGRLWWPRHAPRMARILRRDGTWKDVPFELHAAPAPSAPAHGNRAKES